MKPQVPQVFKNNIGRMGTHYTLLLINLYHHKYKIRMNNFCQPPKFLWSQFSLIFVLQIIHNQPPPHTHTHTMVLLLLHVLVYAKFDLGSACVCEAFAFSPQQERFFVVDINLSQCQCTIKMEVTSLKYTLKTGAFQDCTIFNDPYSLLR